MLGIYSMTTSSEQTVARDSREAIEELADRKGEVLDARIKDNTILIDSHAQQESKVFMIDFVMEDGSTERVMYSQEGRDFDDFIPKEMTRMRTNAPEIGAGETSHPLDLNDFGLEQSKIKSASFLTENGNRFIIDIPQVALLGADGGDGVGGGDGTYGTGTDVNGDGVTNRQDDINGDGTIDDQDVALHMINSMGLLTRIIQIDAMNDASIINGTFEKTTILDGSCGAEVGFDSNDDYTSVVEDYARSDWWMSCQVPDNDGGIISSDTSFNLDAMRCGDELLYCMPVPQEGISPEPLVSIICNEAFGCKDNNSITGVGTEMSVEPYIPMDGRTDYAALIRSEKTHETYNIPELLDTEYNLQYGKLVPISELKPNILGYSESKVLTGDVTMSQNAEGITFSGEGTMVVKLNDYAGQKISIKGNSNGGTVQLVASSNDLTNLPWNEDEGYRIHYQNLAPGRNSFEVMSGLHSEMTGYQKVTVRMQGDPAPRHSSWPYGTRGGCPPPSHYDWVSWNRFNTWSGGTYRGCSVNSSHIYEVNLVKENKGDHHIVTGDTFTFRAEEWPTVCASGRGGQGYGCSSVSSSSTTSTGFWIYDMMPGIPLMTTSNGPFKEIITFPTEQAYLHVKLDAGSEPVTIKGESYDDDSNVFLKIYDVGAYTPYKIIKDDYPIIVGMSNSKGQIVVEDFEINPTLPSLVGGVLKIYPNDLKYYQEPSDRSEAWGKVVFDGHNDEILPLDTNENIMYTAHAYAVLHVTGDVRVTELSLDGELFIPYLDGEYSGGDRIYIPIIPPYKTMHLKINGVPTTLEFGAILGGTGIKIADSVSSTIIKASPRSWIPSAEATVGTTVFAIATDDGNLKAIITETISGEVKIKNTHVIHIKPPRPPPPPVRSDPLSGYVDVYVNGQLVKEVFLGINAFPGGFEPDAKWVSVPGRGTVGAERSVTYTYPDYTLSGSVSVPVNTGDLVEFYVYAHIFGEIDAYSCPFCDGRDRRVGGSFGESTATVNIRGAHINAGM